MPDLPPAPPATTVVEEVVVTAARLPPLQADAAFSVVRLDREDLSEVPRLDEALVRTPGVSLFRRTTSLAANPTTQGVSLRAIAPSGAGRTLVLLDGVPLNDPFGGWVLWSQVSPESLDGGDIVRGAGAGPYGAGALTGVIDLHERGSGGAADLSAGGLGSARASAAAVAGSGETRLFGSAAWETSDGYVPVRGPRRGAADTPLDLRAASAALRLDAPVGEAGLSLRLGGYDEERGAGLDGARAEASGWTASAALARQPSDGALGWRLQAWRRESDFRNSSVSVAPDRSATTPANLQYETPAAGWGANAALRGEEGPWQWELGADARLAEGETHERFRYMAGAFTRDRRAGGETLVAGGYAEGSWTSGPWLVAGGARLDHWRSSGALRLERDAQTGAVTLDDRPADRHGEVASARLGVRRELGQGLAWRAAAYSGFRPPTLNELHRPFRVGNDITEANAALEPERLVGVETGLAGGAGSWTWSATVFWNRIDDAVTNVTIGVGPGVFPRAGFVPAGGVLRERQNAGSIEATGIEAETEWTFATGWTLTLAGALTDAEVDGGAAAPQLTGKRPAQAPRFTVVTGLDWEATDRLTLSADLRWEDERFEDDLNSRLLAASASLDLRAEWRFDRFVLWTGLSNATDAAVEVSETADGTVGLGPPRQWRLGLRRAW